MKKFKFCILSVLLLILGTFPAAVFAHGTEEHHQKELLLQNTLTYSLIALLLLTGLFIILFIMTKIKMQNLNVKKKDGRIQRDNLKKRVTLYKWMSILSLVAVVLTGGLSLLSEETNTNAVEFQHIHGIGFTNSGNQIYVPAHDGLRKYSYGQWTIPEGEKHDYMGFSMVDNGFYSSGHPAPGSSMKNPFGVIKSTDGGKTLKTLDLYGVMDFHLMDVGYESHSIYVFNPKPNPQMNEVGIYYTNDETKTWHKSNMNRLVGDPSALAVHPTEKNILAVGTQNGVYLSKDSGDTFENIASHLQTTALSFDTEGNLLIGGVGNEVQLLVFNIETQKSKPINIPSFSEDAISYIAISPSNNNSLVFSTFKKDIYLSNNNGRTWSEIADEGKGISKNKR